MLSNHLLLLPTLTDLRSDLLEDKKVQAYLESLEVAVPESKALFRMLQNSLQAALCHVPCLVESCMLCSACASSLCHACASRTAGAEAKGRSRMRTRSWSCDCRFPVVGMYPRRTFYKLYQLLYAQSPLKAHSPRVVCQSFVTVPEHKMLHLTGVTHCQVLGCAVFSLSSACTSVCLDRST